MVDQNASPNQPTSANKAEPSTDASKGLAAPAVVRAGEMMLIFALLLIFAVCIFVSIHLYLRRQKRRRKKQAKTKKAKPLESPGAESQPQEKKMAELVGTPLCEMGESEPRHEMEDVEVHERHTVVNLQDPTDHPVYSPAGTDLEAGTMYFGEMTSSPTAQPEPAMHAVYYARF
ncbi:hypothetical protein K458DRAFT_410824 [Lentithecium fluviatile CBS 122367]|uniref:Uncharacterized protein n=1 Tax=Lentithecium fluviatile CBS 122367 TaxID=1168545 RepID=A0A6G1ICS7_9PLEO|nr:hypothetical protein K458DRAFT_410824 [Lentithecium fluviatile CBS 122367]